MKAQIESGFTAVEKAAGGPIAPFFRYPYLSSSPASRVYLQSRDIAQFAVDIDSLDYRTHNAQSVVRQVMRELDAQGRGIVLLHDIHASTALAVSGRADIGRLGDAVAWNRRLPTAAASRSQAGQERRGRRLALVATLVAAASQYRCPNGAAPPHRRAQSPIDGQTARLTPCCAGPSGRRLCAPVDPACACAVSKMPQREIRRKPDAGRRPFHLGRGQQSDAEREWAYDRQSPVGRLDKALDAAGARGWTVVDMKGGWRSVFPPRAAAGSRALQ
jgi:hypothetical protein